MVGSLSNTSVVQSNYKTQPGNAIRKCNDYDIIVSELKWR